VAAVVVAAGADKAGMRPAGWMRLSTGTDKATCQSGVYFFFPGFVFSLFGLLLRGVPSFFHNMKKGVRRRGPLPAKVYGVLWFLCKGDLLSSKKGQIGSLKRKKRR